MNIRSNKLDPSVIRGLSQATVFVQRDFDFSLPVCTQEELACFESYVSYKETASKLVC